VLVEDQEIKDLMDGRVSLESLVLRDLPEPLGEWATLDKEVAPDQWAIRDRRRLKGKSTTSP